MTTISQKWLEFRKSRNKGGCAIASLFSGSRHLHALDCYQNNKMTHRQRLYLWDCKMRQCVVKHATFSVSADPSCRIIKIDVPHRPHLFNPIQNLYRAIGPAKFLDTFVLKNLFSLWFRINSSSCYWAIWAPSHGPSPHRYTLPRKIRLPAPYKNVWRKLKIISIAI